MIPTLRPVLRRLRQQGRRRQSGSLCSGSAPYRLAQGGVIDRERKLGFLFNGRRYEGHPGDTIASALLAHGVVVHGRSWTFHRPRGPLALGAADPIVVTVGVGPRVMPATKASDTELYDAMIADPVHCWPSVGWDWGRMGGFLAAYGLSITLPHRWRQRLAPLLRPFIGWGEPADEADRDRYDHLSRWCDVVVVGAGESGLRAAIQAANSGKRVVLLEHDAIVGGAALYDGRLIDGQDAAGWLAATHAALAALPNVTILTRTSAVMVDKVGVVRAVERCTDHLGPQIGGTACRQRLWLFRASSVLLACGQQEQPLPFIGNDLPGVMLASTMQALVRRWAVLPGWETVIATCDDRAYQAAFALADAVSGSGERDSGSVVAMVDSRPLSAISPVLRDGLHRRCIPLYASARVQSAAGTRRLSAVQIVPLVAHGTKSDLPSSGITVSCDGLGISGGFAPVLDLWRMAGGGVAWQPKEALWQALGARNHAVQVISRTLGPSLCSFGDSDPMPLVHAALDDVRQMKHPLSAPVFIDWQRDVTLGALSAVVHKRLNEPAAVVRHTALGLGTDGGATSATLGERVLLALTQLQPVATPLHDVLTPARPVALAVLAGDMALQPMPRLTPLFDWHQARAKTMRSIGGWLLPACYPSPEESDRHAIERECRSARERATLYDASSLGKIDVQGPDASIFLNRIYSQPVDTMGLERVRYGMMLNEHGFVLADGTIARLGEHHYLLGTTTRSAQTVYRHLLWCHQTLWPKLQVNLTDVSEQWATLTLGGPRARDILGRVAPGMYLGPKAFPSMSLQHAAVAGMPARVARVSFTGELAYEISLPASRSLALWYALLEAGAPYGLTPMGISSLEVLRAEKGYILVGHETDGMVTPDDLGYGHLVHNGGAFVGKQALTRPALKGNDGVRRQLVGVLTEDPQVVLPTGAQIVPVRGASAPMPSLGYVTSSYYSPTLGRSIALAMVAGGRERLGEAVHLPLEEGRWVTARLSSPVFFDQQERRRDG